MGFKCVTLGENLVYKWARDSSGVVHCESYCPIVWGISCVTGDSLQCALSHDRGECGSQTCGPASHGACMEGRWPPPPMSCISVCTSARCHGGSGLAGGGDTLSWAHRDKSLQAALVFLREG